MRLGFLGAAGEVTGSCTLVETGDVRFLVDCGMFQGGPEARAKNHRALNFGFDVRAIDFVLLTHAHIDHSGLLPRLSMLGYRGPIYATPATIDLLEILLPDSAHIQEKESEWQLRNRHRRGKGEHGITPPLYSVEQAMASLKLLQPVNYGENLAPVETVSVRFHDAGHILGSAWLEVTVTGEGKQRRLVFSGDLGMSERPVLYDPEPPPADADVVLIESTYGDRLHRSLAETEDEIVAAFERTKAAKGNLIIPSFAVGRTQEILYMLASLVRRKRLSPLKVYVDSPMANSATRITLAHPKLIDPETRELIAWQQAHPDKMYVEAVADVERSKALNEIRSGAVILSASGMCEAGRIKYHLRENLPRSECSVLIAGFQAAGTLGRRLVDGARLVHIFGQPVPVRARIYTVGGLSAHADQAALLKWLGGFHQPPGRTFVVHGEAGASANFAQAIGEQLGWNDVHLPSPGEFFTL
ncbi:MBL fold metallo-hydrolase RNA specificity domain-containing protein [Ferribacterium limneticum]|uniref:MBL fold metallo-hydrolase RNA specificity domain-containing protein n=1 Tax=Ferribacterium limneticum TaxID=76259 RepID=UPI001CFACAC8|nr:MBL fold metallo-hydrolase [Ferribacterium limneticum]UCV27423.1 MBL fold metallo-hydrolase [Ferribacterium limneticum]UCV31340.1 MBL fold metallo-hydrolase [Ferribacterium limneticum]